MRSHGVFGECFSNSLKKTNRLKLPYDQDLSRWQGCEWCRLIRSDRRKLGSVFRIYFHSSHPPAASTVLGHVTVLDEMSIPALTTIFTPSSSCLSDLYFYQPPNAYYINLGPPSTPDCLPSGWALSGHYSPGICPSGYIVACSSLNSLGSLTETVATCCPS